MTSSRREFLESLSGGAAMFAGLALPGAATLRESAAPPSPPQGETWDLSWVGRLTGKYKAVFDVPEIEGGLGVWRAALALDHYRDVLKAGPRDFSMVVVLRHNAMVLAMRQRFWDEYGVGARKGVRHPTSQQPTDRNPVLLSAARGEVPARYAGIALDQLLARGGIVLGCSYGLDASAEFVQSRDRVGYDAARKKALDNLIPGVILQPSGVFAVVRAQQAGCVYVRAS